MEGDNKEVFVTFPWVTLASSLFVSEVSLTGWPLETRLPRDPTLTRASINGLKGNELQALARALHRGDMKIIPWTEGKQNSQHMSFI